MPTPASSRRSFLGSVAAAALACPSILRTSLLGASAPSERIGLAILGVGTRGTTVMSEFARHRDAQLLAACDPFRERREQARAELDKVRGPGSVQAYADFREVLARRDIDAVVCCTCDHWHAPLGIAAAAAGKDMYIEKPLGPCLAWSKRLRAAVERAGRVFQYGTQQRSDGKFRRVCELVRNGYLGAVKHVDAWCIDGTRAAEWMEPRSLAPEPVPEGLDYDLWTGPAPLRPYNRYRVHREGAFHTRDYSLGFLAGWGAHPLDIAQWGLDADDTSPVEYEGTGEVPTGGLFSTVCNWDVRCRYSSGVTLRFLSHRPAEAVVKKYRTRWSDHGTTFFGERGWLSVDRGGVEASDEKLLKAQLKLSDVRLPGSTGHDRNFLDAVRHRGATLNPVASAVRSDTVSHLSDLAIRLGRPIRWDPIREEVVGDEPASRLLDRPMRPPYVF